MSTVGKPEWVLKLEEIWSRKETAGFYELYDLFESFAEKREKEVATEFQNAFMNMKYDGGVDKPNDEYWHYFFEDTIWKKLNNIFKKYLPIKEESK